MELGVRVLAGPHIGGDRVRHRRLCAVPPDSKNGAAPAGGCSGCSWPCRRVLLIFGVIYDRRQARRYDDVLRDFFSFLLFPAAKYCFSRGGRGTCPGQTPRPRGGGFMHHLVFALRAPPTTSGFDASSPVGQHWLISTASVSRFSASGRREPDLGVVEDPDVDGLAAPCPRALGAQARPLPRPRYVRGSTRVRFESATVSLRLFFRRSGRKKACRRRRTPTVTERVRGFARTSRSASRRARSSASSRRDRLALRFAPRSERRRRDTVSAARCARQETPKLAAQLSAGALEAAREKNEDRASSRPAHSPQPVCWPTS